MNRRKMTVLIMLLALFLSSGSLPREAEPVADTSASVKEDPGPSHLELRLEWQEKLLNDIRAEYLVSKTGVSEELARRIVSAVDKETANYDLDPERILALIIVESWGDPHAESKAGALGLMQVMPRTGRYIANQTGFKWSGVEELKVVDSNIAYGTWYYQYLLRKFRGDEHATLAAYNWGPDHIQGRIKRAEKLPQVYPGKVYAAEEELRGVIWNEYNTRFWRGLDQYVHNARQRSDTPRSQRRSVHCRFSGRDEQSLCLRDGASVPASPGDLSR